MSLKGDKYETQEEVKFRLQGTIVLYDGAPVYITEVGLPEGDLDEIVDKDVARVWFKEIPTHPRTVCVRKLLSSKKFDLAPFPLGYINGEVNNRVFHLSRTAARQNKQGLCDANICVKGADGKLENRIRLDTRKLSSAKSFADMFYNKYPSMKEAIEQIKSGYESVALSRSFCLEFEPDFEMFYVRHKFTKCGVMMDGDKNIRLPNKFKFHREGLEEAGIPFN